jgi:hypothetical protein
LGVSSEVESCPVGFPPPVLRTNPPALTMGETERIREVPCSKIRLASNVTSAGYLMSYSVCKIFAAAFEAVLEIYKEAM